jgi:hypothetical protein
VPLDQLREQIRLTIESMKEAQEWQLINNPDLGLLHNIEPSMRVHSRSGTPTPDDIDELILRVWKKPAFFLAHPAAISAFGRECTRRGVPPPTIQMFGSPFLTWRGIPVQQAGSHYRQYRTQDEHSTDAHGGSRTGRHRAASNQHP